MSYTTIKPITPLPVLQQSYALDNKARADIDRHRREIADILSGKDDRLLLIAGPCSAFPETPVYKLASKLATLQQDVEHNMKIVFRCYTQKPRTNGGMWNGPAIQPNPYDSPDIAAGIEYSRRLMRGIARKGLAIADEAVMIDNAMFVQDLLSYVAIGARSCESISHRNHASMLDMPVGIKHSTDGYIENGVNAVHAARLPTHMLRLRPDGMNYTLEHVVSHGNAGAHLILRGGRRAPNYSVGDIDRASLAMHAKKMEPCIVIDASHQNSMDPRTKQKTPSRQIDVIKYVQSLRTANPRIRKAVRGYMIECFLEEGAQPIDKIIAAGGQLSSSGLSVTDPCLGYERTEQLIRCMNRGEHAIRRM